jgi:hypothetical protein
MHMRSNLESLISKSGTGSASGASASYQARQLASLRARLSGRSLKASREERATTLSHTTSV